ncbi:hypothetical protein E2562_017730 [Oryza meyeriana var. granulata]|uniref:F-box domain-containing protein n=1 Tax=Oryza meyeriana var. granulata TaxID=110450 RepID=A0A6G1BYI6_9ORYZ|nr:hypothetical protein E2562_017729 [Oryza meyeriana var. granulata]KAF0892767.1 hypothetical protein E2562_017730 [Oryza meyeriana var. granulata]
MPDHISEQVLLRLPVKSILRFRSVCKSWCAMIAEPRFVSLQLQMSKSRGLSMLILPLQNMNLHERMQRIRFIGYPGYGNVARLVHERVCSSGFALWTHPLQCDGLVVAAARLSSEIFVCNPATKEFVELPAGTPDVWDNFQKVGFGVDPSTGEHKVVRCFMRHYYSNEDFTSYSCGCEVFTLGSRAWRPALDPPYVIVDMMPLSIPGAIYWSAGSPPATPRMLRFDLQDEEFTNFPPPPCMDLEDHYSYLTELGGKLCYCHSPGDTVQLWVADDGATKAAPWSQLCTIKLLRPCREIIPFAAYEGGIFLYVNFSVICRYDTGRQVLEPVVNMHRDMDYFLSEDKLYPFGLGASNWIHFVVQYSESMVTIGN